MGEKRIDYISKVGFFDDNDIVMNSLNYGRMYYINRSIYAYRQTGKSVFSVMQDTEKAALNALGFDVDLKLIGKEYHESLIVRYARPLLALYLRRDKLPDLLGEQKCRQYLEAVSGLEDSVTRDLLTYTEVSFQERKQVKRKIRRVAKIAPRTALVMWLKYKFKG